MKSGKGHDSGENSKEVWAIGGEGIDTEFEAVLVLQGAVHVDPVAAGKGQGCFLPKGMQLL